MLVFGPEKWDGDDSHRPKRKTWQAGRHGSAVIAVEKQQPGENVLVLLFSHLWLFGWHFFLGQDATLPVENGKFSWATGLGPVPSQDGTATMSGTGSCVSGAIRGGGFAGSTLKERFQHPNWTFRTSELLVRF